MSARNTAQRDGREKKQRLYSSPPLFAVSQTQVTRPLTESAGNLSWLPLASRTVHPGTVSRCHLFPQKVNRGQCSHMIPTPISQSHVRLFTNFLKPIFMVNVSKYLILININRNEWGDTIWISMWTIILRTSLVCDITGLLLACTFDLLFDKCIGEKPHTSGSVRISN